MDGDGSVTRGYSSADGISRSLGLDGVDHGLRLMDNFMMTNLPPSRKGGTAFTVGLPPIAASQDDVRFFVVASVIIRLYLFSIIGQDRYEEG